jgi:phage terminase large subunit-like protein
MQKSSGSSSKAESESQLLAQLSMPNLLSMNRNQKLKILELLKTRLRQKQRNQISTWFNTPEIRVAYPKQMQFFGHGKKYTERGLFGGNRTGKTHAGVYEDVCHLTGKYPEWWHGYKFDRPVNWWAATDTAKNTRDILQDKFCGKPGNPEALGTGMIPGDMILRTTVKHGIADAFESVFVRHVPTGGVSTLQFKSYDQGREAFQGTQNDGIHLDEEPIIDIYVECLLRLMSTIVGEPSGMLILTMTPLNGITPLMLQYLPGLAPEPEAFEDQH